MVPLLRSDVGATVKFDKVLLKSDEAETTVGSPYLTGSFVEAKVLKHAKDDKVTVFKKKKRKGYKVLRGHRQNYTQVEIVKVA
ncbi:MAG: 50S ribosomal protein L21 [Bacteroidetes bacterium]|nr:50S ribosomal protein L21 [Bacteroidota bacterium]